ncbi:hypothetical protein [Halobacillus yeomjeoni]|uniref:Uncharacterized protein n=1 Tax=Halobacillus yeomjeoni TaxID=311194 RepID=A0A931HUP2_9BACI|nr:hypothetical protein [Halobacillus yeomjeoni]MBH0230062.1 hypothetical protein [Halobacillus yeomjeoni]
MNKKLVDSGEIAPLKREKDAASSDQGGAPDELKITDIDANEAIEVVKDTFSLELLREFKADEEAGKKRKTVLEAINAHINEMKEKKKEMKKAVSNHGRHDSGKSESYCEAFEKS